MLLVFQPQPLRSNSQRLGVLHRPVLFPLLSCPSASPLYTFRIRDFFLLSWQVILIKRCSPCRKSTQFWLLFNSFVMVVYEKFASVALWTENSDWTLKTNFLWETIIKLFVDQSEVSAPPAGIVVLGENIPVIKCNYRANDFQKDFNCWVLISTSSLWQQFSDSFTLNSLH